MPNNPATSDTACADQPQTLEHVNDVKLPSICVGSVGKNPISGTDTHHPPSQRAKTTAGVYFRWTIIVLNVGLELSQAILTQESAGGKIGGPTYRKLTVTTSSICLLLSAVEIVHASRANGVVLQQKAGRAYCASLATHGSFSLWFGLVSSTVQFLVNVAALAVKKDVMRFDYLALLFAICYFFSAINGDRSAKVAVVKCASHGSSETRGKFVDGMWVFECPQCMVEKVA